MIAYDYSPNTSEICPPTSPDDLTLVIAAKGGEQRAFVELFHRHSGKVRRATYKVTRNHQDAEDAMQDTFLRAYAHIDSFEGKAKFSSWLIRIAINTSLMILRKKKTRPETAIDDVVHVDSSRCWEAIDASVDIETQYVTHENLMRLHEAIRRLRPSLRQVVEIHQAHGGSIKETADLANLTVAATKSRMLRAKAMLRQTMR